MCEQGQKCENNFAIFKQNNTLKLLNGLSGNLGFPDFLQKMFHNINCCSLSSVVVNLLYFIYHKFSIYSLSIYLLYIPTYSFFIVLIRLYLL